ncbi:MAG: hypothetical protein WA629_15750 [Candidatus Aquilonibacter sp.]
MSRSRRSYTLVRLWSVVIVGLLSGVLGDAGTELFGTLGWLGRGALDSDHQGLLPTSIAALICALGLGLYVIGSRIAPSDPLLRELDDRYARALDACTAFAASWLTVIAIEGYETRFGGVAPFDAGSTIVAHAPALLVSFLAIAIVARALLGAAIRWTARSGAAAVALLIAFLRKQRAAIAAPKHCAALFPDAIHSHDVPELISACGPRAPPLPTLI